MGCVAYENNTLPFLTNEDIYKCQHINQEIIERLNKYGINNKIKLYMVFYMVVLLKLMMVKSK